MKYYIASCVFTQRYPELSFRIQEYIQKRNELTIVRCCVPHYKEKEFEEKLPGSLREVWMSHPSSADFQPGDTVYSLCHNCSAIIDEWKTGVTAKSLWEYILEDEQFVYPDLHGEKIYVQDCWRAKDRRSEQEAVREILRRMNITVLELDENFENVSFCGNSLYRPAPPRNLKLAPERFVKNAEGKFRDCTPDEQKQIMTEYCRQFENRKVISYCHYCHEGLLLGGAEAFHLAELLFGGER
ncbi:MAG: hypothetical protein Q4D59_08970 [Erysipelotrichaceae bacterium]|nr:hypothetical protein [Erysipelotrichaceae bacterium]